MTLRKRCLYIGTVCILCAVILRLALGIGFLSDDQVAGLLTYFYTGKVVSLAHQGNPIPENGETKPIQQEREDPLQISLQAGLSIEYKNDTGREISLEALLKTPLEWDLTGEKPCVLIVHTHGTESYKNMGQYTPSDPYRTTEEKHNMLAVGDRLAEILTAGGVSVLHDRTLHDYPNYNKAYTKARETIKKYLQENPNICLVLDIHRDAVEDGKGNQLAFTATGGGKNAAKLELIVGTNAGGQSHPNWQKNAALAVKLQTVLEKEFPNICRPVVFRTSRYNQDLTTGSLIVEVGAAGNTMEEALAGVEVLAKAIIKMAKGAVVVDN